MNSEYISDALGGISDRHIEAGAGKIRRRSIFLPAAAAVLAFVLIAGSALLLTRDGGAAVSVYAAGTDEELTRAGESFVTGSVSDGGELTGHPLMFYITGEKIESVRLCAKNEFLNFTDLTEKRDEFGAASAFTVPYGEDEREYSFLIYDWVPLRLLSALRSGEYGGIAELPADYRRDEIVLEVTFSNGKSVIKAVRVELLDDGTFFAGIGDPEPGEDDGFLSRPDARPIPREEMYGRGVVNVEVRLREGAETGADPERYITEDISSIAVSWEGREPAMVQMFAAEGANDGEDMELLMTKVIDSAECSVEFPGSALEGVSVGEVWFVITFDDEHIVTSERFGVESRYAGPAVGEVYAYIKDLTNGVLTFDRFEWVDVPGDRARELGITEDDAPSGFLIYNSSERTETLRTASDCGYIVHDWSDSFKAYTLNEHEFLGFLEERSGRDVPYILTVRDGVIVQIKEQYVP